MGAWICDKELGWGHGFVIRNWDGGMGRGYGFVIRSWDAWERSSTETADNQRY